MPSQATANDRLDGWEAIADYLGWTPRTAIRWEKLKGLPVHRVPGGKRQPVYAFRHEIDEWYRRTGGAEPKPTESTASQTPPVAAQPHTVPLPTRRMPQLVLYSATAAAVLLIAALSIFRRLEVQPVMQITGNSQLTDDGTAKTSLVTDGRQVYFTEMKGASVVLSATSVNGGPIRQIPVPISKPSLVDISPDGKFLLALADEANEEEHPLWVVPTADGYPTQIAGVKSGAATWEPNGEWIAFGFGKAIYLTSRGGEHTHLLSPVTGIPEAIRWSADGRRLLFTLRSSPAHTASLWQLDLDANLKAERAVPVSTDGDACCRQRPLTRNEGGYFALANDSTTGRVLHLRTNPWWLGGSFQMSALSTGTGAISDLAADPDGGRLFVLSNSRTQGELVRYDLSARTSTMLIPETFATYLDFTKDMGFVTYLKTRDNSLWVSKADGRDARELTPLGMEVELPRWSPDGKRIAFMGKQPARPWRIFVVPAAGGVLKEASKSDDNQGAPTWSPDGRFLSYGNVQCLAEHACAIHRIDLASGKITTLPDSQGLTTARWSPDGRHIAALNPTQNKLCVFDLNSNKWRILAENINGNDVNWSSDSKYVYTKSSMSGQTQILRVAVGGGAPQTVLDLDSFSKATGQVDNWFSLTPDNALILNRWLNTSEIYALSYSEK